MPAPSRPSTMRIRIDDFPANIYNTVRLHTALGYRSSLELEAIFAQIKINRTQNMKPVTEIIMSQSRGAVQHRHRNSSHFHCHRKTYSERRLIPAPQSLAALCKPLHRFFDG